MYVERVYQMARVKQIRPIVMMMILRNPPPLRPPPPLRLRKIHMSSASHQMATDVLTAATCQSPAVTDQKRPTVIVQLDGRVVGIIPHQLMSVLTVSPVHRGGVIPLNLVVIEQHGVLMIFIVQLNIVLDILSVILINIVMGIQRLSPLMVLKDVGVVIMIGLVQWMMLAGDLMMVVASMTNQDHAPMEQDMIGVSVITEQLEMVVVQVLHLQNPMACQME